MGEKYGAKCFLCLSRFLAWMSFNGLLPSETHFLGPHLGLHCGRSQYSVVSVTQLLSSGTHFLEQYSKARQ